MAKRDPEKTARNKEIKRLTEQLNSLLIDVLKESGYKNLYSLNGKIGGKFAEYIDIKNEVIQSPQQFISLWLSGFKAFIKNRENYPNPEKSARYELYIKLQQSQKLKNYLRLFLHRTYLRSYEELSKKRPRVEEAGIWIGQNNASYGIFVTPRFVNGSWENDKSEIRRFKKKYWSIGHILETGFVIPNKNSKITFSNVNQYLTFFKDVIVRNSGSKYEYIIAEKYCDFVIQSENKEDIPLLIPEFRYDGKNSKHLYRLDFTIIDPVELDKVGFELSPWSTHGYISKTKSMTQKKINEIAKGNFEKEMKKHKDFFRKYGIFVLIYTDKDLLDLDKVFEDMKNYLEPKSIAMQLQFQLMEEFLK